MPPSAPANSVPSLLKSGDTAMEAVVNAFSKSSVAYASVHVAPVVVTAIEARLPRREPARPAVPRL